MEPLILGPSGRPVFTEHEVEITTLSEVNVQGPDNFQGVFLVRLTNFRFIFQDMSSVRTGTNYTTSTTTATAHKMLHWGNIISTAVGRSILWWRPTTLSLQLYGPTNTVDSTNSIVLSLSSEYTDKFIQDVKLQQDRRSWLHYPVEYLIMTGKEVPAEITQTNRKVATSSAPRGPSTAMSGISGLTRHMDEKHKQVGTSLQEAFKDMDSLFEKARDMVAIASRLSAVTKTAESGEDSHFQADVMHLLGIRSPVTLGAHDSHDLYLEELSREVDTFVSHNFQLRRDRIAKQALKTQPKSLDNSSLASPLPSPLSTTTLSTNTLSTSTATNSSNSSLQTNIIQGDNGDTLKMATEVLPLTDLYCVFNRARGSALVSPDDLFEACRRLSPLRLRCRMIELNDGVLAVASERYDETLLATQVGRLLSSSGPMSASQLSSTQGIGLPLANHYLMRAEEMELICRDHSSEGLIFWPNIFAQYTQTMSS